MQCVKSAVIFSGGNGSMPSCMKSVIDKADYIICADSGIIHCNSLGFKADLWVGDFDQRKRVTFHPIVATNTVQTKLPD